MLFFYSSCIMDGVMIYPVIFIFFNTDEDLLFIYLSR